MKNHDIKFSIVVPLYNKGNEIARALDSILSQTYSYYEIVVVDDGSTDNGPEIVRQFSDERIKLVSQENGGVSVARNRGIMEATYEYISFLDADDEWKPYYLETVRNLILQYPEAGAYATAYEIMGTDKVISIPKYKFIPEAPWKGYLPSYFRSALGVPPLWTSAVTIPKYVFDEVGGFPEGVVIGQDKEVWERVAIKFKIAFTNVYRSLLITLMQVTDPVIEIMQRKDLDHSSKLGKLLLEIRLYPKISSVISRHILQFARCSVPNCFYSILASQRKLEKYF
jgi:glycosyltransferase involved in cell wall biosynthesis